MLRLAFDFIITWRETRTRPNAYVLAMAEEAIYIHGAYFYSEFAFQRCAC